MGELGENLQVHGPLEVEKLRAGKDGASETAAYRLVVVRHRSVVASCGFLRLSGIPRLPLLRYVGHRHGGRVQQAPQNRIKLGFWDFGDVGHGSIVTPRFLVVR